MIPHFFSLFGALGKIPIVLQIIPSITSSAPPPMEVSLRSLKMRKLTEVYLFV